jgi:hypothetical protein
MRAHGRMYFTNIIYVYVYVYIERGGGRSVSLLQTKAFTRLCGILSCIAFMCLHDNAHSAQVRFGAYPSIRLRYNVSSEIRSVRIT